MKKYPVLLSFWLGLFAIVCLSVSYYLVIFLPHKEATRLEHQDQQEIAGRDEILRQECIRVRDNNIQQYKLAIESCGNDQSCVGKMNEVFADSNFSIQECVESKRESNW